MFRRNVWRINEKTKKPWVVLVFCLSSTKASFKKPKKNPRFFLFFKNLNQKNKKLKENKKKTSFDLKPKLLQKVLVFWFSRRFVTYWSNSASFSKTRLFQFFLFDSRKDYVTKPRENQKTKKTKLFGEVLVSGQKTFFLVFLEFFVFFWFRFLKTFFVFLKEALVEVRQKTKQTQGFFVFLVRCLEEMYEESMKKPKKPWVFLLFCLSSTKASFKKTRKNKVFFGFLRI